MAGSTEGIEGSFTSHPGPVANLFSRIYPNPTNSTLSNWNLTNSGTQIHTTVRSTVHMSSSFVRGREFVPLKFDSFELAEVGELFLLNSRQKRRARMILLASKSVPGIIRL